MNYLRVLALSLCGVALLIAGPRMVESQTGGATEAPTGFDNLTNGFVGRAAFNRAREAFEKRYEIAEGLGPVYNTQSCAECHQNPVSGGSSQVADLFAGMFDGTNFVDAPGGSLIQDRAIDPQIQETVNDQTPFPRVTSFRTSLNTLGDGFVECVADETLLAISNSQPPAMRGQVVWVPVLEAGGAQRIGRFGWKSQHASLVSFSSDAYLNEMGITTPLQPNENTSNGRSVAAFDTVADPELAPRDLRLAATFLRSTKAPPRDMQLASTSDALAGEQLFNSIGCGTCHVPSMVTAPAGTIINGGTFTVPPELGNKIIHPFSDFCLHDIGVGDGIVDNGPQSTRNKMRTPPLWGSRTRTRLMHDGITFTQNEAIMRHGGEALQVRNSFQALTPAQQNQVIVFLKSL
jgi:CxxC motif-containing protein (DUF1111 family)